MKKILFLVFAFMIAVPLYGKNTISAVAAPISTSAGGESKITVYCGDENNVMRRGVKVKFSVIAGGGRITPVSATSDGSGTIKAIFTLGPNPGTNALKIEAEDAEKNVFLSITGEKPPPSEYSIAIEQPKIPYDKSTTLTVSVKDAKGSPFKDAEVKFNPIDLVTVAPMSAKTDASGIVKTAVKAGKKAGASRVEVSVANLDIKSLDVEVVAPSMNNIAATAASTSIGTRGKTTITVKVFDTSNDPMSNIPVNFQIDSGDAVLSANQSSTNASGSCQVELTAGTTPGVVVVKILNKDFAPSEVRINVSSTTLPPAYLTASASDERAIIGDEVTLTATVEDKEKRLISGASVSFEIISGGGSLLSSSGTADGGKVSTVFILGPKPGKNTVKVTCSNLPAVNVTVNAEAAGSQIINDKPGAPEKLFLYANYRNPSVFSTPVVSAIVTDANNIPVPGVEVKFSTGSKVNLSGGRTVKTDSNGEASTEVSFLGLGSIKVAASAKEKEEEIQLVYGIPEWAYVFPSLLLFIIVFLIYSIKKNSLKTRLVEVGTGLNTGLYIKYKMSRLLERKKNFAACFLDIDEFKNYNIAAGFERGEKVIKELAAIVKKNVPPSGFAAHLGGDDFVFICEPKKAKAAADKIMAGFNEKLVTYYKEADFNNGFTAIKNSDGMLFNYPLMRLSAGIVESEKVNAKSYNELLNAAGRLLKSAKAQKEVRIIDEFDDESERGSKKVKVGWFTVSAFLLAFLFSSALEAGVDISKKLTLFSHPDSTGAGQTVRIKARLTDNRERPISGAYILFEDQNKSDGKGSFSSGWARTDKNGIAETDFTVGSRFGKSMVKASWKGDKVFSSVFITVHVNYTRYLFILIGLVLMGLTVLNLAGLFRLKPLFSGIDTETGMKTRAAAELKLKKLISENIKFHILFMDYRNFDSFNREYGFEGGEKAVKALGEQMKSLIKEFAPKEAFPYYYGEDKFVLIAKQAAEDIVKNLIEEMEIHIPLLCEDKNANYYLLHLSVAMVEVDPAKVKSIGEIMQIAGRLIGEAKTKPGSAFVKGQA
ncbi:MAG: Ig-like domain-containing protein [Candidatus Firestonebacteria bacterium]